MLVGIIEHSLPKLQHINVKGNMLMMLEYISLKNVLSRINIRHHRKIELEINNYDK